MRESAFPTKYSVQFFAGDGNSSAPFYFDEFDDHESAQTWQVDRVDFDKMMLDHAAESGVDVVQRANVREVIEQDGQVSGVRVELLEDGIERRIDCKVVIDASGQTSMLARRHGLKQIDPKLKHASYYTRFRGAKKDTGKDGRGDLDHVHPGAQGPGSGSSRFPATWSASAWSLRWSISPATAPPTCRRCSTTNWRTARPFTTACAGRPRKGTSRRSATSPTSRPASPATVGCWPATPSGFLDPMYSTGVFLALTSGEWAADSALDALKHDDFSAARLGQHGPKYLAGMESMRRLVYAYYDPKFSFPRFLKQHPECRDTLVNLLVGNVFRIDDSDMFAKMSGMVELPEPRRLVSEAEVPKLMRAAYIAAGAAGMICGSCLHDNALAAALIRKGHDVTLIPTYTPIRTDETNVSSGPVFYGALNVYLEQKSGPVPLHLAVRQATQPQVAAQLRFKARLLPGPRGTG